MAKRDRSISGTVLTSWRGVLQPTASGSATPARKRLLGGIGDGCVIAASTFRQRQGEARHLGVPLAGMLRLRLAPWRRLRPWRQSGERKTDRLFDGTAADAVEQLAASLLAQLTPPWSRWFGLMPGPDLSEADRDAVAPVLEKAAATLQSHFDRSNFAVEMHQCYLDLVTAGTACLLFEEAPPGDYSGFRFTAVPLAEAVLEEGADGRLDGTFRRSELTLAQLRLRFPDAVIGPALERAAAAGPASPVRRGRGRPEGWAGLSLHRDPG